jgi:sugar O-acyltransferase (sialic acid O-acetyltransferase NeuD family)
LNNQPSAKKSGDQRPVIVFGNMLAASMVRFCLQHDSPYEVAGFTVDKAYLASDTLDDLPLVPFEDLENFYPPADYQLIIPIGFQKINSIRRERYENAKQRGYDFINYVASSASVWPNLIIGENVLIYEHAIIQPFAKIGNNCIIRSGANVAHHCIVKDHAFVAAEAVMGSKTCVGEQAVLGLGSVVRDQINIANRSFVGAGAVVVKDTEEDAVYVGNPARKSSASSKEVS